MIVPSSVLTNQMILLCLHQFLQDQVRDQLVLLHLKQQYLQVVVIHNNSDVPGTSTRARLEGGAGEGDIMEDTTAFSDWYFC